MQPQSLTALRSVKHRRARDGKGAPWALATSRKHHHRTGCLALSPVEACSSRATCDLFDPAPNQAGFASQRSPQASRPQVIIPRNNVKATAFFVLACSRRAASLSRCTVNVKRLFRQGVRQPLHDPITEFLAWINTVTSGWQQQTLLPYSACSGALEREGGGGGGGG